MYTEYIFKNDNIRYSVILKDKNGLSLKNIISIQCVDPNVII